MEQHDLDVLREIYEETKKQTKILRAILHRVNYPNDPVIHEENL